MIYCAYGSNLNQKEMAIRCPGSKLIGIGKIFGYELCFRGFSDSAYATIVEKENSFVFAALYEVTAEDEKNWMLTKDFLTNMENATSQLRLEIRQLFPL